MANNLNLFDLVPGKVLIDRYEILRAHRQGGMSAVFAVEDKENGERRELQAFTQGLFANREQAAEFADRLQAWTTIEADSIARLHDLRVLDDGTVLFVSDFPPGQSMRSWLGDQARMEEGEVVRIARGILEGLGTVHAAGLVHGDIKPASIYFQPGDGRGVLVDGGITPGLWSAKHLGTRTALIGTPYYAPLEQFTGDSPDETSDLYNLATVMYELLTGSLPWSGRSYVEVFQSKMQKEPPKMSLREPGVEVTPEIESAISRGLRAERSERYGTARAFLEELEAAIA
ncbi:MAG: serine/threonine protein kinase [bacterium]|nr:serine/threonine protein kinase [bacterium]